MGAVTVDQAKLVLNSFAAVFQNSLICGDIVTFNKYDSEMDDRNGLSVVEQIGPRYKITQTVNGVADLTAGTQESVFGSEQFVINRTFGADMGWGDFIKIRDIGSARESTAITNAATNLAEQIDAYVLGVAALASNNWVGTPANDISDFNDVASGYTRLKEEGVSDADLGAVLNWSDKQKLGNQIGKLPAPDAEAVKAIRKGFTGELGDIPTMFTQQLPLLTTGTRPTATGQVNGATQNTNYSAVAKSSAPGRYMTQSLILKTLGAGTTIRAGEVFTVAGVFAFDNRKQGSLGRLQQFVVVADATADGAGAATVTIFPALIVPGSGGGSTAAVNTAHATVTAAPADNALVSFVGTPSTQFTPRMVIQKEAIVVNTAQLIMPATGEAMRKALTKVPVSVRMWKNSNFNTGEHGIRFDIALTANIRERRRICRINGA